MHTMPLDQTASLAADTAPLTFALSSDLRLMSAGQAVWSGDRRLAPGEPFPFDRLFAPEELPRIRSVLAHVQQSGRAVERRTGGLRTEKGNARTCTYSVHPIVARNRQIVGVMVNLQPAVESHAQMANNRVFEALPQGVFTVDRHYRITAFNQTAEHLTGYRRDQALGRACRDVFRSDLCRAGCPLQQALETGQTTLDQPVTVLNRDGRSQTLIVNVSLLKDRHGRVVGGVETFRPAAPDAPANTFARQPLLPAAGSGPAQFAGMVGQSRCMQRLFARLPDIAASEANLVITGESGTGKELLARAVHRLSARRQGPFMAVNCAALAETLLESELFGHERGAFTGATHQKAGRFERAAGGTLFLDEIGDLKPALQVKLLRVLEQRQFERVGGKHTIPLNARVISATNRDLNQALARGAFRADLYYRLRTVAVQIPPLRERPEDIPLLVDHFIKHFNVASGKHVRSIDPKVMRSFLQATWPGNIRELQRLIEHAFVFVKGPIIFARYLPQSDRGRVPVPDRAVAAEGGRKSIDQETILNALAQAKGRRADAAALLGISRTSLWRRMKALNQQRRSNHGAVKRGN